MYKRLVMFISLIGVVMVCGLFILNYRLENSYGNFGIFLWHNDELVISDEDIFWYNWTSHEIKLTHRGIKSIETLRVSLWGTPFIVKINGEAIYNGSFVTPISSVSMPPSNVVIETRVQNTIIKVQNGYPPSMIADSRNNSKVLEYFQKIGKLIQ